MEGNRRWRPSPALVVAFIALFVAGAGSATAARLISGRSIKDNSVTGGDVRNNSLRSRDVRDRSLLERDFRRGQLPAGPQGPAGRPGANGLGTLRYISRDFTVGAGAEAAQGTTTCPAGTYPTGGDAYMTNPDGAIVADDPIEAQFFTFDTARGNLPNGWRARTAANDNVPKVLVVDAICANASARPGVKLPGASATGTSPVYNRGVPLPVRSRELHECRQCCAFCDRVVHPAGCVASGCSFLYLYDDEETGRRYMGCMNKVFAGEIDVEMFEAAQRTRHGYGGVKMTGMPISNCRQSVERAYDGYGDPFDCVNRGFFEKPVADDQSFDLRDRL